MGPKNLYLLLRIFFFTFLSKIPLYYCLATEIRVHIFTNYSQEHSLYFSQGFVGWLVVLGFNATLTAKVISWRSVTHTYFLAFSHQCYNNFSFESHRLPFSHASAEVRGKNTPERKVASTGDRTHKL